MTRRSLVQIEEAEYRELREKSPEWSLAHRYSIPAVSLAALKRAGKLASFRLLQILEDERFEALPVRTQLEVINTALDKAYGVIEAPSTVYVKTNNGIGSATSPSNLSQQLEKIEGWTPPELTKKEPKKGPVVVKTTETKNVVALRANDVPKYGDDD